MKRYVMFCSSAEHWLQLGVDLKNGRIAEPCLWIGDDMHYDSAIDEFGKQYVKKLSELRYFAGDEIDISYKGELGEFLLSDSYFFTKDICLKMMDRLDDTGSMSRLDREVWYHNVVIWTLKHFQKFRPDFLLMSEAPHNHAQYAIYEICKFFEVPILKFSSLLPVPILFPYHLTDNGYVKLNYAHPSQTLNHLYENLSIYVSDRATELNGKDIVDPKHLRQLKEKSSSKSFFISEFKREFKNNFRFLKYPKTWFVRKYKSENPLGLWYFLVQLIVLKRRSNLFYQMQKEIAKKPDLDSLEYVYYPLHYEPERTTNPDGGIFQDQLVVLLLLRRFLPESVKIIVKEHPSQFLKARTGYRGRSPLFYRQIKNIKGLTLVDYKFSSSDLIRDSIAVATISGTVGFEAACMGKKCILFGEAWFNGMPNIFRFQGLDNFEDFYNKPISDLKNINDFFKKEVFSSGLAGFQNLSTIPRISEFLTDEFYLDQRLGLMNCCTSFINDHINKH